MDAGSRGVLSIRIGSERSRKHLFAACIALLGTSGEQAGPVQAATAPALQQADVDSLYHWAYSAAFGTGAYRVGDEKVYVLKVEPRFVLPWLRGRGVTTTLRVPFTIGVQNVDLKDLNGIGDLEDQLSTVTVAPGLEWQIPMRRAWVLRPYAHYGWGTQVDGSESSLVYYFGVNSRFELTSRGDSRNYLINALQYYGQVAREGSNDQFARIVTGLEGGYPLGDYLVDNKQLYFKPHIAHYWYFNGLDVNRILQPPVKLKQEFEVGLAVGIRDPEFVKRFSVDRIGVAIRKSEDVEGFRIYVSSVFE